MDIYFLSVIAFIIVLGIVVYFDRKNVRREFIILLRKTKRGKDFLTKTGRMFPRFWKIIGSFAVIVCFWVSIQIFYQLFLITANNLTAEVVPGIGLLLPSLTSTAAVGPGYFAIPFWYWIIAIGLLALVHEGSHGIMAAREKVNIKSLGWGLFLVIPLAFVEPDERQLAKKKTWPQLRVFAAGSFANFVLAGVALVLMGLLVFNAFAQAGVDFGSYPAQRINTSDVAFLNSHGMYSVDDVQIECKAILISGFGGKILTVSANNKTYLSTAKSICEQLNKSEELLVVYEDYSAIKENLTGAIIEINGEAVSNTTQLRRILERVGPGQTVSVVTTNGTENKSFVLETAEEPMPVFKPDPQTYVMVGLEHAIPGIIDFSSGSEKWVASLLGGKEDVNWYTIQSEIKFWEWVEENYPGLQERVSAKTTGLKEQLENYPRSGFIGISSVYTKLEPIQELKAWSSSMEFLQGLLLWLFRLHLSPVGHLPLLLYKFGLFLLC